MTRNRTRLDLAEVVNDAEPSLSESASPSFEHVLAARLSRRDALRGGLGLATTTLFAGAGLSACDSDSDGSSGGDGSASGDSVPTLSFNSIEGFSGSGVRVPEGYLTQILIPWGPRSWAVSRPSSRTPPIPTPSRCARTSTPTAADATQYYRNEANTFGWLVEIDPYDPSSTPRKRTAMGRFRHEGAQPGLIESDKRIAFYMGDDARGEYIYKFVTADAWDPDNPDADMLDKGTLYVARFDADGTGEWLPLDYASNAALAGDFTGQADVLVNTRTAADVVGATPMDRPEWSTTDPVTGEIYFTLTNNTDRHAGETDAANPRGPNTHGHVIRFREDGDDPAATGFTWDIFVFGANANADPDFNISGLTLDNEFGSPDGLWFDPRGVLWIQTDNGAPLDSGTNDQMLAVIPAGLPGDRTVNPDTQAQLKRFFVGLAGCEVTGAELTQDGRTLFVNIQHPDGDWPDGGGNPARSATVVIRREDGGEIAL